MDNKSHRRHWLTNRTFTAIIGACFALILASCALISPAAAPTAELTATSLPTDTPEPSSTPTEIPTETPEPTATPDKTATAAAAATAEMDAKMVNIAPELEKLGYELDSGNLIYTGQSFIPITVDSYMEDGTKLIVDKPIKNFILQAEIGWNSTSGLAGCGIMFRAEEDLERGANFQFAMLRLSGAPGWDIEYYNYGEFQANLTGGIQFTAAIDERQDAVNKVTLIVEDGVFQSIINTTPGMDVNSLKLPEGRIALLTWQESGKTTCTFRDVWVWELNPASSSDL